MILAERHIINSNNKLYKEIDNLAFLSKNLYNKANYTVRQKFIESSKEFKEGKIKNAHWMRSSELSKLFKNDECYQQLPRKVSQEVLKQLERNWKSFFELIKLYNKKKITSLPKLPNYKHKTKGRNLLVYNIQAISGKKLRDKIISLSQSNISFETTKDNIRMIRIVPKYRRYIIEVVYKKEVKDLKLNKENIIGIDLGLNNLATITSNHSGVTPILINGRLLKSFNQFYNKKKALLQSYIGNKKLSNRINTLSNKREYKIEHYLHHVSKYIVQLCIKNDIGTIVIGLNKDWKRNINIGKKNNQNFVNIPYSKLINQIIYKSQAVGIDVKITEESYTSKCSFIDNEPIQKQEKYLGRRVKRGLFISAEGKLINADVNGSANIIKKVFPEAFNNKGIEGVVVRPVRVTPSL